MIKTPGVQEFCGRLWELREAGKLPASGFKETSLVHDLYDAISEDLKMGQGYDPECDNRVRWAREVVRVCREGKGSHADADLEAIVAMVLGKDRPVAVVCGKDRAAGEG